LRGVLRRSSFVFAALLAAFVPLASSADARDAPPASGDADAVAPATAGSASQAQAPAGARSASQGQAPARAEKEWYGWQTLIVDAASVGAFVAGAAQAPALSYAGLAGYALGGPAVHLGHDRVGVAFADLGIRLGLPLIMAAIGAGIDVATSQPCGGADICVQGLGGALIGLWAGHATAVVLDAAVFSVAPVSSPSPSQDEARAAPAPLRFVPSLAIGPRGVSAGVGGSF
jgi:hypothetical protein